MINFAIIVEPFYQRKRTMTRLPAITQPALGEHRSTVIWLHGLGATNEDFASQTPHLGLSESVKFILPQAPIRPITWNDGMEMPGWYDIVSTDPDAPEDYDGVAMSADLLRAFIRNEREQGIPSQNIFIVGFSQGGAMALYTGLTHPERLGGIVGLSTYLPVAANLALDRSVASQNTPILMAHGTEDPTVDYAFGKKSQMVLRDWDYHVDWSEYPIEHTVDEAVFARVVDWLSARMVVPA